MAKNRDMTAEEIFALVASYMNEEHVSSSKKHMRLRNLPMRDSSEVQVRRIFFILSKLRVFLPNCKWTLRQLQLDFSMML